MKELWVKKTIWRRYLIEEGDLAVAESCLSDNSQEQVDFIEDCFDKNENIEYDQEEAVLPVEYEISSRNIDARERGSNEQDDFNAIDLWNNATKLSTLECNGYWKALRDLERLGVVRIGGGIDD